MASNGSESLSASVPRIPVISQEKRDIKYKIAKKLNKTKENILLKESFPGLELQAESGTDSELGNSA